MKELSVFIDESGDFGEITECIENGGKFFPPTVIQRAFAQTKTVMHYSYILCT